MKAFNKNIIREIVKTKSRFLSIFTICAIGVGFFSGVRATGGDMKVSADNYYDSHELFDLRVLSTFGLTDDDAAEIAKINGIDGVFTSKYTDLAMHNKESEYLTRVYSWNNNAVNKIDLRDGRTPEAENECIVSFNRLRAGLAVGDKVTMADLTGADEFPLEHTEYTIVGTFDTPMYISLTQRGSTTIGDGSIDAFMYVTESNFVQDVYTEIYVTSEELRGMQSYSAEYEQLRDEISEKLEELGVQRSEIRYNEVLGEALEKIADGEDELAQAKIDGEKELADAKSELEDAAQKISDGEKELADAKAQLDDGAKQLADGERELADAKKELDDGWSTLWDSKIELSDAERTLIDSKKELDNALAELDKAESQLKCVRKQLDESQAEVDSNRAEIEAGMAQLEQGRAELSAGREQYESGLAEYNAGLAAYEQKLAELTAAEEQLKQAELLYGADNPMIIQQKAEIEAGKSALSQVKQTLDTSKQTLDAAEKQLTEGEAELAANEAQLNAGAEKLTEAQQQIDTAEKQYAAGLAEYEAGKASYEDGQKQYIDGMNAYLDGLQQYNDGMAELEKGQKDYDEGAATLAEKREEYEQGKADYENGAAELEDAKQKYSDGLKEYSDGVETFNREIADAEQELAEAREKIADAGKAKWYVFLRDDNIGYAEYESNAERMNKISTIFPIFFLLVAALVCLTTMSRMVEEQRTAIGTMKALGYTNGNIMRHYMTYALTAAAAGGLIGAAVGLVLFPTVIVFAYSMMYNIVDITYLYTLDNIILSVLSMVLAIALTVFFSCKKALAETPASLMRPKAPKAGKRVLIERIGFIWNNLSFFAKVSGRNLFRYKRRMFMTVVGIAGCTALSLTGFGLKDSITDIVDLQYNSIYNYSGYIAVDSEITQSERSEIYDALLEINPKTQYTSALIKQYTVSNSGTNVGCYVTAVEDCEIFEKMVDMHERVSRRKLTMSDGVIATEKLAKLLGVKTGDEITLQISDGVNKTVKIAGITEHYASHYLYLSESDYKEIFGKPPVYNMIYFTNGITEGENDSFSEAMLTHDGVLSVMMKSGSASSFRDMVKILDLVIIVLIASAGALAFVVLYNLSNVNITERIREIATLKVLGFYDGEVSSYVFRENIILSLMGGAVGLLLGVSLCQFVIQTAEIDEVMFGRNIHPISFVYAFIITIIFSLIVNLIMTGVLKKISMVESLKSVE
ncbi:MAG: FtsX-like permease family protein [Oscillospiraceae bacterium]